MCGKSKAVVAMPHHTIVARLYIGYNGGSISFDEDGNDINRKCYGAQEYQHCGTTIDKKTAEYMLKAMGCDRLAELILHLVENGEEL